MSCVKFFTLVGEKPKDVLDKMAERRDLDDNAAQTIRFQKRSSSQGFIQSIKHLFINLLHTQLYTHTHHLSHNHNYCLVADVKTNGADQNETIGRIILERTDFEFADIIKN